jgi:hypothetical protein
MVKASTRAVHMLACRAGIALAVGAAALTAVRMTSSVAGLGGAGYHPTAVASNRTTPGVHGHKAQDPPSFTNYEVATQAFPHVRNFETKILLCPSSAPFVVGGGAETMSPRTAVLTKTIPLAGPVPADGWAAAGYTPGGFTLGLVITVICVA